MRIKILNKSLYPNPQFQSDGASGLDLHANIDNPLTLVNLKIYKIPTGIYIEIPKGYEGQVRARSGLSLKHGLALVNGIGTIDSDYRGEIQVIMTNLTDTPYTIKPGDRIAQLVIIPVITPQLEFVSSIEELTTTERAAGGFGHSGN